MPSQVPPDRKTIRLYKRAIFGPQRTPLTSFLTGFQWICALTAIGVILTDGTRSGCLSVVIVTGSAIYLAHKIKYLRT